MEYTLTRPIPDIWTAARDMFARLRHSTHYKQWLYALEALVRKLVLLEALALAPPLPKLRPIQLPLIYTKLPPPPRERSAERCHAFRLWPRTKAHPARIRLLDKPQSRAEFDRDALYQAQLERLKRARANRAAPVQLMLRRLNALNRVLEKPLPYAKRLARKLRRAPKAFLAKIALKRQPRSPYVDPTHATRCGDSRLARNACGVRSALSKHSNRHQLNSVIPHTRGVIRNPEQPAVWRPWVPGSASRPPRND